MNLIAEPAAHTHVAVNDSSALVQLLEDIFSHCSCRALNKIASWTYFVWPWIFRKRDCVSSIGIVVGVNFGLAVLLV